MSRTEELRLRRGDHIYVDRTSYSHHGIYIGSHDGKENMVIHYKRPHSKIDDNTTPCQYCGYTPRPSGGVVTSCLDCFRKDGQLGIYEYDAECIRRKHEGTCSSYTSRDDPEVVIIAALKRLRDGFGNYSFVLNNCEDFAHYCKTGTRFSMQSSYMFGCRKWYFTRYLYPVVKALYRLVEAMRKNPCMPEKQRPNKD